MLLPTFLRAILFASFLVSWIPLLTTAAPIPSGTTHASTAHPDHKVQVQIAKSQSSPFKPKPSDVHLHPVARTDGHLSGSVLIGNARHVNGMTTAELHAHAQAAKDTIKKHEPNAHYHVQAHHTPGDAHVMIHAVPKHHLSNTQTSGIAHHAMRHAGPSHPDAPRASSAQTQRINSGLNDKLRPADGSPRHQLFSSQHTTHAHDSGIHGPVKTGTIPVARSDLRNGMTAGQLQTHAEWINKNLVPDRFKDKAHIYVNHEPGNAHVDYHITPARTKVTNTEIKSFLNHQGDSHFNIDSMTGSRNPTAGNHQYTFSGTLPAHTKKEMTTAQQDVYAKHAQQGLIETKDLIGQDANGMVVTTAHKRGEGLVDFHTQPKTDKLLETLQKNGYAPMNRAMAEAEHTKITVTGKAVMNRHSDEAVLEASARRKGIPQSDSQGFLDHVSGQVLGVAGAGDRPCLKCHRTFRALNAGVVYTDMDRSLASY